jgi:hypothetical protein
MLTPNEYRLMAEECLLGQARSDDVRDPLIELARIWTEAASKLDGSVPMYPRTGIPPRPSRAS